MVRCMSYSGVTTGVTGPADCAVLPGRLPGADGGPNSDMSNIDNSAGMSTRFLSNQHVQICAMLCSCVNRGKYRTAFMAPVPIRFKYSMHCLSSAL
jgi:hypothetical protein